MANQIPGVKEKLIEAATIEFLEKGYKDASLRDICKNADTNTSSVYVRFKDKLELFSTIVDPFVEEFKSIYINSISTFNNNLIDKNFENMVDYTSDKIDLLLDCIYNNYRACKLVICCSDGTKYSDFIGDIAEIEAKQTIKYVEDINSSAISSNRLSPELLHMLCSAYWSGLFEIVRHDMKKEDAKIYIMEVKYFFERGWKDLL